MTSAGDGIGTRLTKGGRYHKSSSKELAVSLNLQGGEPVNGRKYQEKSIFIGTIST